MNSNTKIDLQIQLNLELQGKICCESNKWLIEVLPDVFFFFA